MPEQPPKHVLTEMRRMALAMACALPFFALPGGALAQNVPAGLRACAAQSDPGQRLDCYDREMKRLLAPAAQPARPPAEAAPPAVQPAPIHSDAASSAATRAPQAAIPASPAPQAAREAPAESHRSSVWKIFAGGAPLKARIVRVDRSPDTMVLHLDDGQVWRQTGRAAGDLTLRAGDEVTITKHFGSYWLSSRHVSDMRVRRESP